MVFVFFFFFFSSRRRHTRCGRDWSSHVCSSDLRFMLSPWTQTEMAHAGQMPVRADVSKQLTKINSYFGIFAKQLKLARPRTPSPNWPQIDQVLSKAVASAIQGAQPTQAALDDAARQIDQLLAG